MPQSEGGKECQEKTQYLLRANQIERSIGPWERWRAERKNENELRGIWRKKLRKVWKRIRLSAGGFDGNYIVL